MDQRTITLNDTSEVNLEEAVNAFQIICELAQQRKYNTLKVLWKLANGQQVSNEDAALEILQELGFVTINMQEDNVVVIAPDETAMAIAKNAIKVQEGPLYLTKIEEPSASLSLPEKYANQFRALNLAVEKASNVSPDV